MTHGIDFSLSYPIQITLLMSALFPVILLFLAKTVWLSGRNALQFLATYLLTTFSWVSILLIFTKEPINLFVNSLWISFFLYHAIILIYLEIWGLLSRGYTLGLLLTFYKANTPLTIDALANSYRGGKGLYWLIHHRFAGLAAAKIIKLDHDKVTLTARGKFIASIYDLSIQFFGLRYSG